MSGGSGAVVVAAGEIYDDFDIRTEATTWGDASSGPTYSYPSGIPSGDQISVANGVGIVQMDIGLFLAIRLPENTLWTQADGFVMTFDFQTGATIPTPGTSAEFAFYTQDGLGRYVSLVIGISSGAGGWIRPDTDQGSGFATKEDWLPDTWYTAKMEHRPNEYWRARVWPRDETEPTIWVTASGSGTQLDASSMELEISNGSGGIYTLTFDNIMFGGTPVLISGR